MSILSVYHQSTPDTPNKVLTHADDIAATLAEQGIHFEQREIAERIRPGTGEDDVAASLRGQIDRLSAELSVSVVEILSVNPEHAQKDELRAGLVDERRHGGKDVQLFVSGRGLLNVRVGEYVYALVGERGDLITVPAGAAQWFDFGEQPNLVLVRFFESGEAQQVRLTGDDAAKAFPGLDDTF